MRFFCPACWNETDSKDTVCPHCGEDITGYDQRKFQDKLINALGHPDPDTVQRAVWILGSSGCTEAVEHLIRLFQRTGNPYLKVSILNALDEIGTEDALEFIMDVTMSEAGIVRKSALNIMEKRWKPHE